MWPACREHGPSENELNIASFDVNEFTKKYVTSLFSALMLPWRFLPLRRALSDIYHSLQRNYPKHLLDYFVYATEIQIRNKLRIENREKKTEVYWRSPIKEVDVDPKEIAFFGGGKYCEVIVTEWLEKANFPNVIFDSYKKSGRTIGGVPIYNVDKLDQHKNKISKIIITSPEHHTDIVELLRTQLSFGRFSCEIIDPFSFPKYVLDGLSSTVFSEGK